MARTPDSGTVGPGSIPHREFCTSLYIFEFLQTLRAYFQFQATIGNKQSFAYENRGFKVSLDVVKTHAVLCRLCENWH